MTGAWSPWQRWRYVGFPLTVLAIGVLAGVFLAVAMEGLG